VLRYTGERLEIVIQNAAPPHGYHRPAAAPSRAGAPARAGARPGPGLGVRGMRERAELYGGTLDAGPCPDGGFLVTAVLPYGAVAGRRTGDEPAATGGPR
jgi:hypothetical protein